MKAWINAAIAHILNKAPYNSVQYWRELSQTMAALTGQIIYADQALTGTLRLKGIDSDTLIEIETFNGYFTETELQPGKYQAQLVSNTPEGVVPEIRIEIPCQERVEWASLLVTPKAKKIPRVERRLPENLPIDAEQADRLRKIPPPDPVPRENPNQIPDYWEKEEFIQVEEIEEEEAEEEVESPPPIDRKTQLLLEMAARTR